MMSINYLLLLLLLSGGGSSSWVRVFTPVVPDELVTAFVWLVSVWWEWPCNPSWCWCWCFWCEFIFIYSLFWLVPVCLWVTPSSTLFLFTVLFSLWTLWWLLFFVFCFFVTALVFPPSSSSFLSSLLLSFSFLSFVCFLCVFQWPNKEEGTLFFIS